MKVGSILRLWPPLHLAEGCPGPGFTADLPGLPDSSRSPRGGGLGVWGGNELSLSSDTFVLILSVSCCLLTGDRWLIMQLGTAHYVPISRLLNHFKILNSLINILWRAQGSDQGCFSPGHVLTHWDPAYMRSWRGQTHLGRTMSCVPPRAVT